VESEPWCVHDHYAVSADYREHELSLRLHWVQYSHEQRTDVVTKVCHLRFAGVTDLDASPPRDPQMYGDTRVGNLWRRVFPRQWKTARALVTQILLDSSPLDGEPLDGVEAVPGGYLLEPHISGDYFVRADAISYDCS
jgi:hypothetical protein